MSQWVNVNEFFDDDGDTCSGPGCASYPYRDGKCHFHLRNQGVIEDTERYLESLRELMEG